MTPAPKFSIAAVIIGLYFLSAGVWLLANDIALRVSATYTEMEVASQRESTCRFRSRSVLRDPCVYPTVTHTDAQGRKHSFELRPWRPEKLRWELKKSKNRLEVLYIPNSPSPDDDQIFEENGMFFFGLVSCLFGLGLIELERRDYIKIRALASAAQTAPD